ncbi:MAG TPA: DUF362 domain-containing protein [Candidatus Nanoarchaeia archaeon]|nr:DUF362 domain-containing protein [Candidatus Nanoarchaeia archaeon]
MVTVALAKCSSYDSEEVYHSVKKSVSLLDVPIKNSKVLIKPNLLYPRKPEDAVTTHPEVVRAAIQLFKQLNCEVLVGDSPGIHDPIQTAQATGILQVCRDEGIAFVKFMGKKSFTVKNPLIRRKFDLTSYVAEVDHIVNIPKLKTHVMTGSTIAIKNLFGLIVGLHKSQFHFKYYEKEDFAKMLIDLANTINPSLSIVDGIIGMEGNGPGSGQPKKAGIIAASEDPLALDIIMNRFIGIGPMEIWTNKVGLQTRPADFLKSIKMVGDKIKPVPFKRAEDRPMTFIVPKGAVQFVSKLFANKSLHKV